LLKIVHFETCTDEIGRIVKTYELQNAGISIIEYNNLSEVGWNESFDRLAEYLEKEIKIQKNLDFLDLLV